MMDDCEGTVEDKSTDKNDVGLLIDPKIEKPHTYRLGERRSNMQTYPLGMPQ
jgi:hypothetical protein